MMFEPPRSRFQLSFLLPLFLLPLLAEPAGTPVSGRVLDQSHAPIAGARIVFTMSGRPVGNTAVSTQQGEFTLPLTAGSYTVTVSADGFLDAKESVQVGGTAGQPVEIVLQVAAMRTAVTVSESAGYQVITSSTATKTPTPLLDVPQSVTTVSRELMKDQLMMSLADVVRYVPGITMAQGEGHRDAPVIRGNSTTSDFYVNGVRDDVQYFRDLYNLERVEAVKGPNAMIFGRGGGGGIINRVTKEAQFMPLRELSLQGGSFGNKRFAGDVNQAIGERFAFRLNGMYENSDSFRNYFNLERYGIAPTLTYLPDEKTRVRLSYEYFHDARITDRGIPSFQGRPAPAHRSTFFGNPNESPTHAGVNLGNVTVERQEGKLNLRNSTLFGAYDKFYQNVFPGAVNAAGTMVSLSGYNTATQRTNIFNQTDATYLANTGPLRHTLLVGAEFGRQATDNFRQTAFFAGGATSINVPFGNPTDFSPVSWRQNATDADNRPVNTIAATYIQDQVHVTRFIQLVGGVRYDHFDMKFHNNRNNDNRRRIDNMISPRAGIVIKPITPLSLYVNYSVAYLPSSGDQFGSLDATTETLKPEKFTNYEAGLKWDVRRYLSVTTAVYRLNRTNTRSVDPNNPAVILQTGSQRTNGYELGINGNLTSKWTVSGGYGYQDAFISSATSAARLGAQIAMVPRHTFSLWNNYKLMSRLSGGLGLIHQANMWAGVDNTVTLPGFTRADAALYYTLTEKLRIQANVENLSDNRYYVSAHSNNNITPGFARALRIGMTVRF
ncbi:MAG TPA: TonB-dependent siderophore receptor [Bryobacteraceae bacterium]|nr:TonB-dependent siderophore receptor [Bryobacteraceae bacterium]